MATAEELLAAYGNGNEETMTINLDSRVISIPASILNLGVESDDDVKRLHFSMPRHYGEFDLSKFKFTINFENAAGTGDLYPVDDLTVSDTGDTISFSWLVDRVAFEKAGDVEFSICMKMYDIDGVVIKELNTTPAILRVLKGLETSEAVVENNPSLIDRVLFRLYAVEAATGNGQDGYYSIVKITDTDDGVSITIQNKDGETEAELKDGYTPIRGTDYWTAEDEEAMRSGVSNVLKEYLNNWVPILTTVTLPAADWVDNAQTVNVEGVKMDSLVLVGPNMTEENYNAYIDAGVKCIAQNDGNLIFECDSIPAIDLNVDISIYYGDAKVPEPIIVPAEVDPTLKIAGAAADAKAVGDALANIDFPDAVIEVDPTLSEEGKAADAKAVGDAIDKIPVSVNPDTGYTEITGLPWVTDIAYTKTDDVISVTTTFENGKVITGSLAIGADGLPASYTEDGVTCTFTFTGFDATTATEEVTNVS